MFGSSAASAGAARVALERARVLEQAAQLRSERERTALQRGRVLVVQSFLRMAAVQRRESRRLRTLVFTKLSDVDKVSAIFLARGIPFVPPPPALFPLLLQLGLAFRLSPHDVVNDRAVVAASCKWLHRSMVAGRALAEQAGAGRTLRRLVRLYIHTLCDAEQGTADRLLALDCVLLSSGLPALSSLPVGTPAADVRRVAGASAAASAVQTELHSFVRRELKFATACARPLCFAAGHGPAPTAKSTAATAVASAAVCAALILAYTAGAAGTSSGSGTSSTPSSAYASPIAEFSSLCASLLTVPWVVSRLEGTPASHQLTSPSLLDTLIACTVAGAPVLLTPDSHCHVPALGPARGGERTQQAGRPPVQGAAGVASSSLPSLSTQAPAYVATPAVMLPTRVATIFDESGSASVTGMSFFSSDTAKAALSIAFAREAGGGAAALDGRRASAWPPESFLLGNLLQMLADPPCAPEAAAGPASPFGSGRGSSSYAPPPSEYDAEAAHAWLGPVLAGASWPGIAYQTPASACRAVSLLCDLMAALPAETWTAGTPLVWMPAASGSGSETRRSEPVPMPRPLVSQLRRLSSERLAKACAGLLVQPRLGALKLPRLRLDPSVDPERGSYDDVDAYGTESAGQEGSGGSGGSSNLAAAAGGLTSMVRAVSSAASWAGSKLAQSLFSRKGKGKGGEKEALLQYSTFAARGGEAAERGGGRGGDTWSGPLLSGPSFDDEHVLTFCRLYADLLGPRPVPKGSGVGSGEDSDPIVSRAFLLRSLAFHPALALPHALWLFIADRLDTPTWLKEAGFKAACAPTGAWAVLTTFCAVLSQTILVVDDYELFEGLTNGYGSTSSMTGAADVHSGGGGPVEKRRPLSLLPPLRELRHAVRLLRDALAHVEGVGVDSYAHPTAMGGVPVSSALASPPSPFWARFASVSTSVLRLLYERHCQRPLGPPSMWQLDVNTVSLTVTRATEEALDGLSDKDVATRRLLARIPFAVPFAARVSLYDRVREADRRANQEGQPQVRVAVNRARLFETSFAALQGVKGQMMRRKLFVTFVNEAGMAESGIDAGGLFKELWTELASILFSPKYGLWAVTETGDFYPNPSSSTLTGIGDEESFLFLGRVTGKALYEGITVGPRWARFWLAQVLGRVPNLHDLPSLDPELYKSLMFLRTCAPSDVPELCLTFTIAPELGGGGGTELELLPNGANIPVDASNRLQYIHLVAHHRLMASIAPQTDAFVRGLREVLPAAWLWAFSPPELQVLASGSQGGVDVSDLQAHAQYAGGYGAADRSVKDFWAVVEGFSPKDRAALLRFCTSCERPPPLGFSQLEPRFTIARVGIRRDDEALPTSSTCFHILKLPNYSKREVLREKLLLAIHSGAGFELS